MGTLNANIVAPSQTLAAEAIDDSLYGGVTAPAAESSSSALAGFGLTAALELEVSPDVESTLVSGNVLSADVEAPAAESSGQFGDSVSVTAPAAQSSGTILVGRVMSGAVRAPLQEASGTIESENVAVVAVTAPRPTTQAVLLQEGEIVAELEAPAAKVTSTLVTGNVASAAVTAPAAKVVARLSGGSLFTADVTAPAPDVQATLVNALVEAYAAWLMNTANSQVTEYTNFEFHSLVEFNGSYYGVSDTGIYELDGLTDDGSNIDAAIEFGITDLDGDVMQRIGRMVVDLRADGNMRLHVKVDGQVDSYTYVIEPLGEGVRPTLVRLGRGLRSRNWQIGLDNIEGADFDLDSLDFTHYKLNRRVG